jgi:hypothetical protein
MRRIPVELYRDLAECVDSSGTLRFIVMVFAVLLLAAEDARHCVAGYEGMLHRALVEVQEHQRRGIR